jgi:hypothetical protein
MGPSKYSESHCHIEFAKAESRMVSQRLGTGEDENEGSRLVGTMVFYGTEGWLQLTIMHPVFQTS